MPKSPILILELARLARQKAEMEEIPFDEAVGFTLRGHTELYSKVLAEARGEKPKRRSSELFAEDVTANPRTPLPEEKPTAHKPRPGELF